MAFELIPAIDLLEGRCVRLAQGRYNAATVYGEDPAAMAAEFARPPIRPLHVVDLDGAKVGEPRNRQAVAGIAAAVGDIPVQLGGGIRSESAVEESLALGVDRVVLGTVALREPQFVRDVARRHPGRVAVGIDAREGRVAVEGWTEASEAEASEVAKRFEDAGVAAIIYTDIARDGMLTGPNLDATVDLAESVAIPIIASGGIACEADVLRAAALAARGLAGAIVGRALYTGALDLGDTLEKLACS